MKFGVRTPSLKKSFKARTTGKAKRAIKKAVIPGYGKKGMGWIKNPKKAAYNAVYHRTTIGIPDLIKEGTQKSAVPYSFSENVEKSNLDSDNSSLPADNFVPTDPPEPPNNNGSKRRGCIIKIVIGFIVICILGGMINSCSGGSNSAASSSRTSSIASSRAVSSKVSSIVSSAASSKVVSSSKAASSVPFLHLHQLQFHSLELPLQNSQGPCQQEAMPLYLFRVLQIRHIQLLLSILVELLRLQGWGLRPQMQVEMYHGLGKLEQEQKLDLIALQFQVVAL